MPGYWISVTDMDRKTLREFVVSAMPNPEELVRMAREAGIPERCPCNNACEITLEGLCECYRTVPTRDLTLKIDQLSGSAAVFQYATDDHARTLKFPLRELVREHLVRKLTAAGHVCTVETT